MRMKLDTWPKDNQHGSAVKSGRVLHNRQTGHMLDERYKEPANRPGFNSVNSIKQTIIKPLSGDLLEVLERPQGEKKCTNRNDILDLVPGGRLHRKDKKSGGSGN